MAVALQSYWDVRNGDREGVRALDAALALDGPAHERGRALWARSAMSWWDRGQQRDDALAAFALADASGDLEGQCMALDLLATHATLEADFVRAKGLARRQRELAEELGDPFQLAIAVKRQAFAEPGVREARAFADEATALLRRCGSVRHISRMLLSVVMAALTEEHYDAAEELAAHGLRAAEEARHRLARIGSLANAGLAALFLDRIGVAEQRFREQLAICRSERVEAWWGEAALGLAAVAAQKGDGERAAILAGASEAPMNELMNEADRPVYERLRARFLAPARAALGEAAWARAEAAGAALTPEQVFEVALGDARTGSGAAAGAAPEPMR
jgi:hypothetical protein